MTERHDKTGHNQPAHKALVTAPFRGEGWDTLNALAELAPMVRE